MFSYGLFGHGTHKLDPSTFFLWTSLQFILLKDIESIIEYYFKHNVIHNMCNPFKKKKLRQNIISNAVTYFTKVYIKWIKSHDSVAASYNVVSSSYRTYTLTSAKQVKRSWDHVYNYMSSKHNCKVSCLFKI